MLQKRPIIRAKFVVLVYIMLPQFYRMFIQSRWILPIALLGALISERPIRAQNFISKFHEKRLYGQKYLKPQVQAPIGFWKWFL